MVKLLLLEVEITILYFGILEVRNHNFPLKDIQMVLLLLHLVLMERWQHQVVQMRVLSFGM
uniref:Uncharacterized protein n=1 Tax=Arcella intermedia TaxID=1963864 RepID=A0A6B2LWW6_9EUKA